MARRHERVTPAPAAPVAIAPCALPAVPPSSRPWPPDAKSQLPVSDGNPSWPPLPAATPSTCPGVTGRLPVIREPARYRRSRSRCSATRPAAPAARRDLQARDSGGHREVVEIRRKGERDRRRRLSGRTHHQRQDDAERHHGDKHAQHTTSSRPRREPTQPQPCPQLMRPQSSVTRRLVSVLPPRHRDHPFGDKSHWTDSTHKDPQRSEQGRGMSLIPGIASRASARSPGVILPQTCSGRSSERVATHTPAHGTWARPGQHGVPLSVCI